MFVAVSVLDPLAREREQKSVWREFALGWTFARSLDDVRSNFVVVSRILFGALPIYLPSSARQITLFLVQTWPRDRSRGREGIDRHKGTARGLHRRAREIEKSRALRFPTVSLRSSRDDVTIVKYDRSRINDSVIKMTFRFRRDDHARVCLWSPRASSISRDT